MEQSNNGNGDEDPLEHVNAVIGGELPVPREKADKQVKIESIRRKKGVEANEKMWAETEELHKSNPDYVPKAKVPCVDTLPHIQCRELVNEEAVSSHHGCFSKKAVEHCRLSCGICEPEANLHNIRSEADLKKESIIHAAKSAMSTQINAIKAEQLVEQRKQEKEEADAEAQQKLAKINLQATLDKMRAKATGSTDIASAEEKAWKHYNERLQQARAAAQKAERERLESITGASGAAAETEAASRRVSEVSLNLKAARERLEQERQNGSLQAHSISERAKEFHRTVGKVPMTLSKEYKNLVKEHLSRIKKRKMAVEHLEKDKREATQTAKEMKAHLLRARALIGEKTRESSERLHDLEAASSDAEDQKRDYGRAAMQAKDDQYLYDLRASGTASAGSTGATGFTGATGSSSM